MELSVEVLNLVKELRYKKENIISNKIGRSATSVCANIAESKYGHSRADFIAELIFSSRVLSCSLCHLDLAVSIALDTLLSNSA